VTCFLWLSIELRYFYSTSIAQYYYSRLYNLIFRIRFCINIGRYTYVNDAFDCRGGTCKGVYLNFPRYDWKTSTKDIGSKPCWRGMTGIYIYIYIIYTRYTSAAAPTLPLILLRIPDPIIRELENFPPYRLNFYSHRIFCARACSPDPKNPQLKVAPDTLPKTDGEKFDSATTSSRYKCENTI